MTEHNLHDCVSVHGRWGRTYFEPLYQFPLSSPSGTNINAALLSAAQLINPPSSSRHLASHRVPLVIFLTDGEATIGETAGDTILTNARKALGSASLFGLAFGDDADFLLLKRLALDNRGVARMVYEDADAALQLKGFYDEVASPLLSDVQLSYLDDQAFDVTRSLFPNYFQGSELVVAGKRVKMENRVLTSQTEGNGSVDSLDCLANLEGIPNVVHRLWAYFTIKELLQAKLNTTDPATQRLLVDKATNLSLRYNFVTPVTSLVVVQPELDEVDSPPSPHLHSIQPEPTPSPSMGDPLPHSWVRWVDGDPHFVVSLGKLHENILLNVFLSFEGIIVDGHLMGAPPKNGVEERSRTYFDLLTISTDTGGPGDISITLSLDAVVVEGEGRDILPINQQGSVRRQGVTVTVDNHRSCWVELAKDVQFLILFHEYQLPTYLQKAHLGFYITDGRGLSASTQGLLGTASGVNIRHCSHTSDQTRTASFLRLSLNYFISRFKGVSQQWLPHSRTG
uniref:Inter-alpha-trypsin inhibitor heavy chain family member 6 n=1 Tax=Takifugu rubripes TaxID=31033 RepID=A0A674N3J1_TAKRU